MRGGSFYLAELINGQFHSTRPSPDDVLTCFDLTQTARNILKPRCISGAKLGFDVVFAFQKRTGCEEARLI